MIRILLVSLISSLTATTLVWMGLPLVRAYTPYINECLSQCPSTVTGGNGELLYNNISSYGYRLPSNNQVVECGYGSPNGSAGATESNGTFCMYSEEAPGSLINASAFGYNGDYCPSQATQCCSPYLPNPSECILSYECYDENPLGNALVKGIVDTPNKIVNCTYSSGTSPCTYDLTSGCLLQQQGYLQCTPQLTWGYTCPEIYPNQRRHSVRNADGSALYSNGPSDGTSTGITETSTSAIASATSGSLDESSTVATTSSSIFSQTFTSTTSLAATTTSSSSASPSSTLPADWEMIYACAQDTPQRVLANVKTYVLANNTPAACMDICAAGNYGWAGVEYGDECYCGTGDFTNSLNGWPEPINVANCSMPCAGDALQTCGGPLAIQLYEWNGLGAAEAPYAVPANWNSFLLFNPNCFQDAAAPYRALPQATMYTLPNNNTPGTCIALCDSNGFTLAGLEYGDECWCGMNYPIWQGPKYISPYASGCDTPCAAAPNFNCGGSWAMVLYEKLVYQIYPYGR